MAKEDCGRRIVVRGTIAMRKLGSDVARYVSEGGVRARRALIVGLFGDLGSGKTTFAQGFAKELGVRERVTSPTFILMRVFLLPQEAAFRRFIHIDAYRIQDAREVTALGWETLATDPETVILIEWAERVEALLPNECLRVMFRHRGEKEREVTIENNNQ